MPNAMLPLPPPGTDPQSEEYRRFLLSLQEEVETGLAPIDAQYWLSTGSAGLTNERNLGALASGYVKVTTVAGVATPSSVASIPASDLAGTLPITKGGTNSGTALSGASVMVSDGSAIVQGPAGTSTTVLHGNAAGQPTYGPVDVAADVAGRLPFANLAQGAAQSVLGVTGSSAADVASIQASADGQVLMRSGGVLSFAYPATIYVQRTLSAVEINSLNTTPIQLVAAAGAQTVLMPLMGMYWATRTASTFSLDPNFRVRWNGLTTDLLTVVSMNLTSASPPNPADGFKKVNSPEWNPGFGVDPRNRAIEISASTDTTGGTGASVRIAVIYAVMSF